MFIDARWGRGQETPGEDPLVSGAYATAFVRGVQGAGHAGAAKTGGGPLLASAALKHFVAYEREGYGGERDRLSSVAVVSAQDMLDTFLPPFRDGIQEGGASGLMCSYNAKFFYWETGYFNSMDIMHDRAGYYICWGCLVWVPSLYVSPALYISSIKPAVQLGTTKFCAIVVAGLLSIWINYDSDRQRQEARRTKGNMLVWGKKPRMIKAKYETIEGESKTSLLLASGWWSISRHFHYLPEIAASFFWTLPAGFDKVVPYSYVIFLTILLFDLSLIHI